MMRTSFLATVCLCSFSAVAQAANLSGHWKGDSDGSIVDQVVRPATCNYELMIDQKPNTLTLDIVGMGCDANGEGWDSHAYETSYAIMGGHLFYNGADVGEVSDKGIRVSLRGSKTDEEIKLSKLEDGSIFFSYDFSWQIAGHYLLTRSMHGAAQQLP